MNTVVASIAHGDMIHDRLFKSLASELGDSRSGLRVPNKGVTTNVEVILLSPGHDRLRLSEVEYVLLRLDDLPAPVFSNECLHDHMTGKRTTSARSPA
jgi:hypothetical protein